MEESSINAINIYKKNEYLKIYFLKLLVRFEKQKAI